MDANDHELLRRYAHEGAEPAFAELVGRHLNLVYSAARRQTRSGELAQDIAQSVFVDLARAAKTFDPHVPVVAWLHLVTRRTAIDVIRRESRRLAREQAASEISAMKTPSSHWSQLEPQLDEVLTVLDETDRVAVLLRFFENKSLREVGEHLGASEEAARKRVSRALEQLRGAFLRRGIVMTSAGLAADLSAHAIETAPAALNAAIASSALSAAAASSAVALKTAHLVVMTTLQKTTLVAALALAAGVSLYEAGLLHRQRSAFVEVRERSELRLAQLGEARIENDALTRRLASLETKIDERLAAASSAPLSAGDAAATEQMKTWLANIDRMKQLLREQPALAIPELALVDDSSWFDIAAQMPLDTEEGLRRALAQLRARGENQLGIKIMAALGAYVKSGATVLPTTPAGLLPFFDPPIAPQLLDRYEVLQSGPLSALSERDAGMALIGPKSPADAEYDSLWLTGTKGFIPMNAMSQNVSFAQKEFAKANQGQKATTAAQLAPYLKWPVDLAALEKRLAPRPKAAGK